MATTSKLHKSPRRYKEQVSPTEVCTPELSTLSPATQEIITPHTKPGASDDSAEDNRLQRDKQIDALSLTGPKKPKSKDSWLNAVGKHSEDSPLNRIIDEGEKIREAERVEPC